jgi:hypothetical protein
MRGVIRNCPVCGAGIPTGKLMCRDHWFMVTPATRRQVNKTWREYKVGEKGEAQLFALRAYRIAHEAAIAEAIAAVKARAA